MYPNNFNSKSSIFTYPVFNSYDFIDGFTTIVKYDLLNYANLYNVNTFSSINYFTDIFALNVNGLPQLTFQFLVGITENVQSAITYLKYITVDMSYDLLTSTTLFNNNLISNNFGSLSIASSNGSISNLLSVFKINVGKITSKIINSQKITTNYLSCGNLTYNNDIGLYLYTLISIPTYGGSYTSSLICYPIIKSKLATILGIPSTNSVYILYHIKPNYRIDILNINNFVIYSFTNSTNDIIYNKTITLSNIYYINLYLNNILLI